MNKNYWDLTDRPHTERKLKILEEYLYPWAKIIFNQWRKYGHKNFKTAYYIDCFAGRGKYHKDAKPNSVNGSPLIALNCAEFFQKKFSGEVKLKCIFVETKKKYVVDLQKFCQQYRGIVDFSIRHADINDEINSIFKEVGNNATLFFVDPWGLKELKKTTVRDIIGKKGPNDLLLNYICGTPRVLGKVKNMVLKKETNEQLFKLIDSVSSRLGLKLMLECFDKPEREVLQNWAKEILKDTKLQHSSVYRMLRPSKNEAAYYLLFASRSVVAKKIVDDIFSKKDSETYDGQTKMPFLIKRDFDL
ncbi:MAG TPA: three-Cys-motif partner protein TcmP [Nevskiaceae bacterium]|nr:three-Cys-motif partner protein TcmP [Nevskiaceae bacterium]